MVVPLEITHPNVKEYFKEIPFYNRPIEKPKIKRLKSIDLLAKVFSGYAIFCNVLK